METLPAPEPTAVVDLTVSKMADYITFYSSDEHDVYKGNYAGLMDHYKVNPEVLTAEERQTEAMKLLGEIVQTKEVPQAFLMLAADDNCLLLAHRLCYFPKPLGAPARSWEERVIGLTGDVMGTQLPQALHFNGSLLRSLSRTVKVPKTLTLRLALEADPNMAAVVPVGADAAEDTYDTVRTRYAMCVPPKYVPIFLGNRLTPREGFVAVEQAVRANEDEEAMAPLVDWLRVALTRDPPTQATGPARSVLAVENLLNVPMLTAGLAERLHRIVSGDLPDWNKTAQAGGAVAAATTRPEQQQIEQLLLAQLLRQQGTGATESAVKLPSAYFKGTINLLLRLTSCQSEAELPEIYHRWANATKREVRPILQEVFDDVAANLSLPEPVATADLALAISTLRFASADEDDLEQGLQPFTVAYHSQKTLAAQAALNGIHDMLHMGNATPQLADLWAMKTANKLWIPTKMTQLVRTLKTYAVVLATVVGTHHPLYRSYRTQVVDCFDEVSPMLELLAEQSPRKPVYAQVLRWIQLRVNEYWRQAQRTPLGLAAVPRFAELYDAIKFKSWHAPEIPALYLRGSEPALDVPTNIVASSDGLTVGRVVATEEPKKVAPKYIKNPEMSETLRGLGAKVKKIQTFLEVMGDGKIPQIPKNNKGHEMCLAWYLKDGCYSTCQRKESHTKLAPSEEKRLVEFIKKGLAKQGGDVTE